MTTRSTPHIYEVYEGLTGKQRLFVEAYLGPARGNATEAARLAGYKGTDTVLGAMGAENLKKPKIKAAIEGALVKAARAGTIPSKERVLEELGRIALDSDGEETRDRLKALELLAKYHRIFAEPEVNLSVTYVVDMPEVSDA